MALIGNGVRLAGNPMRTWGPNAYSADRMAGWDQPGCQRNYVDSEATVVSGVSIADKAARNNGYVIPYCWTLAPKSGGMSSQILVTGEGSITAGNLAGGLNGVSDLTGSGDITNAALGLILSAVAALTGSGDITADILGKLEAVAALTGTGDLTAAMGALADIVASLLGTGEPGATIAANGDMAAAINVTGDVLTTANVAAAVWNALIASFLESGSTGAALNAAGSAGDPWVTAIPGAYGAGSAGQLVGDMVANADGYSPNEVFKIMMAALAGKVSGMDVNAPVFRSADDTANRITATVDVDGNRTAVTLNP